LSFWIPLTVVSLPVIGFAIITFFGKWLPLKGASVAVTTLGISFLLSLWTFVHMQMQSPETAYDYALNWVTFGGFTVTLGFLIDRFAATMMLTVTLVAWLIHIYSIGYMHGDRRFSTYFGYLGLFTTSMLGIITANNYFQVFIFWELVGLSSYLLIGFWYEKKSAADAGKKAFIVNRIGDFGFLVGIFALFTGLGTFSFSGVFSAAEGASANPALYPILALGAFGVLCGAIGKSAQLPLHVWLPDAMEGPTPVSALIHAATMVAAGVYLVARSLPLFIAVPEVAEVVAWVGGLTAIFSASIAIVQVDIKRVLAYSTISQLGYMMMAAGVGSDTSAIFHLTTHAYFKALLFLGAGSVIHALHTQDLREMGGLFKKMKTTAITFIVGGLALAGFPPFAGFFSKDEILASAYESGHFALFGIALFTALLTAFYTFRLIFLAFFGKESDASAHAHESPKVMTIPLIVLGFFSLTAGWIAIPGLGGGFGDLAHLHHQGEPNYLLMCISVLVVAFGIFIAWAIYYKKWLSAEKLHHSLRYIAVVLEAKYWFDQIYHYCVVRPLLALSRLSRLFDLRVIDGAVNTAAFLTVAASKMEGSFDLQVIDGAVDGTGWLARAMGRVFRRFQTGQVQEYLILASIAVLAIVVIGVFLF
jgi:NADH-quinone oxidoreductase subunit L